MSQRSLFLSLPPRLLLLCLLLHPLVVLAVPGETGTCSSQDGSCLADESMPSPGPLVASVLLDDGVRAQLVRPDFEGVGRSLSTMIRTQSPIMSAVLAPGIDGKLIIGVVTFDGQATWYTSSRDVSGSGGARATLASMGPVQQNEKKRFVSCIALGHSGGHNTLALGHQDGRISVWHHQESIGWVQISDMQASHHSWESVSRVAVSRDGRILLGATGDNVALWRLPAHPGRRDEEEAPELRHLHGGGHEISATAMGMLVDGRHLVVVAFTDGAVEGWAVSEDNDDSSAVVIWKLGKGNSPRYVAAAASSSCVVAGDMEGMISLWKLNEEGELVSQRPHWKVMPSTSRMPAGSLAMLSPRVAGGPERVAISVGNTLAVLDVETGREVYKRPETGSPMDFAW